MGHALTNVKNPAFALHHLQLTPLRPRLWSRPMSNKTETGEKPQSEQAKAQKSPRADGKSESRETRLAEALRANLRRRKAPKENKEK